MNLPRSVVVLVYDGVNAVDVAGPAEAFAAASDGAGGGGYAVTVVSPEGTSATAESGLTFAPDGPLEAVEGGDYLLIPGGRGIREPSTLGCIAGWLRDRSHGYGTVVAICTGAYALAEAGLLDGRTVTTHWAHAADLSRRYPKVEVDPEALFRRDGRIVTSGGVTAGIDLTLELIAEDFGHEVSARVAREMVVFTRRSGNQSQFSEPLRLMSQAPDPLTEVGRWAANHLAADLSVRALARRAHLSPRQFSRRFHEVFGTPPATYVRRLRVDGARVLLEQGVSIQKTAPAVGFTSVDGLRRAFERAFGLTPRAYRERFRGRTPPPPDPGAPA
jgi:transcriptional regulator GlxA family with amidase domain